jgi:hypothetical protein
MTERRVDSIKRASSRAGVISTYGGKRVAFVSVESVIIGS